MSLGSDDAMDDDGAFSVGSESDATSAYSDDDGIVVDPPVIKTDRGGSHESESADFQVSCFDFEFEVENDKLMG